MIHSHSATLAGLLATLGLGLFAGTVIGDDGGIGPAERISGSFSGGAIGQTAVPTRAAAADRRAARRTRKPRILHGAGQPVPIEAGGNSTISLRCPRKFPVPISAGLETSIPGIFPGLIARDPDSSGAMLVAAVNQTATEGQWTATVVCMKGAKQA